MSEFVPAPLIDRAVAHLTCAMGAGTEYGLHLGTGLMRTPRRVKAFERPRPARTKPGPLTDAIPAANTSGGTGAVMTLRERLRARNADQWPDRPIAKTFPTLA